MSSQFEGHLNRLRRGVSTVEVVHAPHDRWPLRNRTFPSCSHINISVLDSSFDPPTLAHLALANIPLSKAFRCTHTHQTSDCCAFHAKLLLLSVRNADKSLKPGDATYEQRMDMMIRLSEDVKPDISAKSDVDERLSVEDSNTAVAIIDEPTFVGKARLLLEYFREKLSSFSDSDGIFHDPQNGTESRTLEPQLTFIVGMDTLERLCAPRYYSSEEDMNRRLTQFLSPDGDNCRVICARRITPGLPVSEDERERSVIERTKTFISSNRIAIVDIGDGLRSFSSSETRATVHSGSPLWKTMVTPKVAEYIAQHHLYSQASS